MPSVPGNVHRQLLCALLTDVVLLAVLRRKNEKFRHTAIGFSLLSCKMRILHHLVLCRSCEQHFFQLIVIVGTLFKIIKTVFQLGCLCGVWNRSFFLLLVSFIQSCNIFQSAYVILLPAGQNRVNIFKLWLMYRLYGAFTGSRDDLR